MMIIGTLSAIAIQRTMRTGETARLNTLKADLVTVRDVIELYAAEHNGRTPNRKDNGDLDNNGEEFVDRLLKGTDALGEVIENADGDGDGESVGENNNLYGPYLRTFPANPFNGLNEVRIGGPAPGAGTHGWHYDPTSDTFSADDSPDHAAL